jgi:ubiquinone/menaquinone biosynthesis C-methylase UbiE
MSSPPPSCPGLKLLPRREYHEGHPDCDPVRFYFWPVLGRLYRRRVECCLAECHGGARVLEIGFGSGVTFLHLHEHYREIGGLDLRAQVSEVARVFERRGISTRLENGTVLHMPHPDGHFDTVLLISILEHLKPDELHAAFNEIRRVLRPGGQMVYGVPTSHAAMHLAFRLLGYDIRQHHFSNEDQVRAAARQHFREVRLRVLRSLLMCGASVYEVGHFVKGE